MNKKVKDFWDDRSGLGGLAGTDDFILSEIEQDFIVETVPNGARVLDIGCGNAQTLLHLAQENDCYGVGLDFSDQMADLARRSVKESGLQGKIEIHCHQVPPLPATFGQFDIVLSQRCLVNLATAEEQRDAIHCIQEVLKPGGLYLMIESSEEGLENTNVLRRSLGLDAIEPPWHNRFFRESEVLTWQTKTFAVKKMFHISSTYHFLSRVIYAALAAERGEELRYDSDINLLSTKLPQDIGEFGPVKAWIWQRKDDEG